MPSNTPVLRRCCRAYWVYGPDRFRRGRNGNEFAADRRLRRPVLDWTSSTANDNVAANDTCPDFIPDWVMDEAAVLV